MNSKSALAHANVQLDTARVKVTEWRFPPNSETGWHRHAYDYLVVPITGGRLLLESADASAEAELVPGQSYSREVGVEHNVINVCDETVTFVEIELK